MQSLNVLEGADKDQENVRIVGIPTEIRKGHVRNLSL